MDSITHLFLGGAIAAAIAPAQHRRAALMAGALINSLPDVDVLPLLLADDPLDRLLWHRGLTHSVFLLPLLGWALWAFFKRRGGRVAQFPRRWFWLFQATLLAHPLVDAFTTYGTQLFWPLPLPPVALSSIFIIDPVFTLILMAACLFAWFARERPLGSRALHVGVSTAALYLALSLGAKWQVERAADHALVAMGLPDAPRMSAPMPFNLLLWRVVAMTPEGFVEGQRSLVADRGEMRFARFQSDVQALAAVGDYRAVQRLAWFNRGFMKAHEHDGQLVLSDIRMGLEPDYSFRFVVAARQAQAWREVPVQQLRWPWEASGRLKDMWRRIWREPAVPRRAAAE
ncbi:metal-dependent hydrolase [Agrilutibacter solisilvae]|uniref:Metal-dependent hydrolase n=1 Tax=Agrilutibacter solisilvae TaxID=2763317 RepID=A0A974XZE7_9GAMM|nr:metal-dependent hydrolase [Lysobacter solisilvae]QSX78591.1 metal-dependent hydrolase [Lysobacter solisilvae]